MTRKGLRPALDEDNHINFCHKTRQYFMICNCKIIFSAKVKVEIFSTFYEF
mgnify:CR=1 FL=1|jgi:hypothetical protein